jgi:hypothetical protein
MSFLLFVVIGRALMENTFRVPSSLLDLISVDHGRKPASIKLHPDLRQISYVKRDLLECCRFPWLDGFGF